MPSCYLETIKKYKDFGYSEVDAIVKAVHEHFGESVSRLKGEIETFKVEKRGDKWCTVHCSGPDVGKVIKCFDSKEKAMAQHRAIQANK